jgi:hypothetical protein
MARAPSDFPWAPPAPFPPGGSEKSAGGPRGLRGVEVNRALDAIAFHTGTYAALMRNSCRAFAARRPGNWAVALNFVNPIGTGQRSWTLGSAEPG